jgi:ATP-dependent Clp endopeptidase proteolytic subunit ClpP
MLIRVKDNKLTLHGIIFKGDDVYFEHYFLALEDRYDEIEVHVHTKGGDVFAGNYIESRMRLSKATINMQIDGTAFSMGAFLLPSADKRTIVSNGFIMIHQSQGTTRGTAKDHRSNADLLDDMNENFIVGLMRITGKSRKYILKWFDGDTFFNAKKALKEGLVDSIVDPVIDIKISDTKALAETDVYGRFSALLTHTQENNHNHLKTIKTMKNAIIAKFGLVGVSAESSDTAVLEAMQKHLDSKTEGYKSKYDALKTKFDTLSTDVETKNKAKIDALLKPLENKVDKDKLAIYRAIGIDSGVAALEVALEGAVGKQRKGITDFITGKEGELDGAQPIAGWNWDKYQKEDPRALESLAKDNPEAFNALYKAKFGIDFKE